MFSTEVGSRTNPKIAITLVIAGFALGIVAFAPIGHCELRVNIRCVRLALHREAQQAD